MLTIRKSADRGFANHGWLESWHTFSFAGYFDRNHMNFQALRVINEDIIAPAKGFATHPHDNMEIVTYIISGALAHKDSMGNGSVIRPGEIQRMTAGTGITHSEFNPSGSEPCHLLQIWIMPREKGLEPGYEQSGFTARQKLNVPCLIASHDARKASVKIHQDADIYTCRLDEGATLDMPVKPRRAMWLQLIEGEITINGADLTTGDAAALRDVTSISTTAASPAHFLLFDLAVQP